MGNGGAGQRNLDHVLLRVCNALQDCFGNFSRLAEAVAHGALAVADNNQSGELHDTAALDGLGNAVQVNDLFDHFRAIVFLGCAISIVSHCSSSSD